MKTDMKNVCSRFVLAAFLIFIMGCTLDESAKDAFNIFPITFDFSESNHGWQPGFSDYPAGPDDSIFFELKYAYTDEPSTLAESRKSIMLSGNNHSDDLFMFLKKQIDGLKPNTNYTLTFNVKFASDAKAGSVGAGGAPGESVFLKVGAAQIEPKSLPENGNFVMNIDKGNQAESGQDMVTIGNIVSSGTVDSYSYVTLTNTSSRNQPFVVTTNSNGELWLIVGTDSGYEGITTLYYSKIDIVFSLSR